jgi:hypothetical protein
MSYSIQHFTFFQLPLNFALDHMDIPDIPTVNAKMHPIQYIPLAQGSLLHSRLKRKGDGTVLVTESNGYE